LGITQRGHDLVSSAIAPVGWSSRVQVSARLALLSYASQIGTLHGVLAGGVAAPGGT
jgi:hypothetical protein